jgi:putative endonuclease
VEVKLRKNSLYGEAREFVTAEKQRKLRLAASYYISGNPAAQELQPRFDVAEVYAPKGAEGPISVHYLENAFE